MTDPGLPVNEHPKAEEGRERKLEAIRVEVEACAGTAGAFGVLGYHHLVFLLDEIDRLRSLPAPVPDGGLSTEDVAHVLRLRELRDTLGRVNSTEARQFASALGLALAIIERAASAPVPDGGGGQAADVEAIRFALDGECIHDKNPPEEGHCGWCDAHAALDRLSSAPSLPEGEVMVDGKRWRVEPWGHGQQGQPLHRLIPAGPQEDSDD